MIVSLIRTVYFLRLKASTKPLNFLFPANAHSVSAFYLHSYRILNNSMLNVRG